MASSKRHPLFHVKRFREKPNLAQAKRFLRSRNFVWNMGVYGWRVETLLTLFHTFAPDIAKHLDRIQHLARAKKDGKIADVYRRMPSISLDFAITEKQNPSHIVVLPGDYGWSDIGHWGALQELISGRSGFELKKGVAVQTHAKNNFIYSTADVAIGLAGVDDLIIVTTPDALLICSKQHVQDVKKLVTEFSRKKKHHRFI